jgi:hypothetical protein
MVRLCCIAISHDMSLISEKINRLPLEKKQKLSKSFLCLFLYNVLIFILLSFSISTLIYSLFSVIHSECLFTKNAIITIDSIYILFDICDIYFYIIFLLMIFYIIIRLRGNSSNFLETIIIKQSIILKIYSTVTIFVLYLLIRTVCTCLIDKYLSVIITNTNNCNISNIIFNINMGNYIFILLSFFSTIWTILQVKCYLDIIANSQIDNEFILLPPDSQDVFSGPQLKSILLENITSSSNYLSL